MPKIPLISGDKAVKAFEKLGYKVVRQRGSHLRMRRGNLAVTAPIHPGDLPVTVMRSILRQAQLTDEEFLALL